MLKPVDDPFREVVLELLAAAPRGLRKADVMSEAAARGLQVRLALHLFSECQCQLCLTLACTYMCMLLS